MKLILLTVLLLLLAIPIVATAQSPYLRIYFDQAYTRGNADCPAGPAGTVAQTLYIVAHDFDSWLSAIEFRVLYPPELMFLGDFLDSSSQLHIGSTPQGIGITWPLPANGFSPLLVCKVGVLWMCDNCSSASEGTGSSPASCAGLNSRLCFDVYPSSGHIRAIRWPDEQEIFAGGKGAIICATMCGSLEVICPPATIPVEQHTWGAIKALYQD